MTDDAALAADVCEELRRLAAGYLRRERHRSVQATELVHEAHLRLATSTTAVNDRSHFIALAALAMRRLLVERARRRAARKRGAHTVQITLDDRLPAAGTGAHDVDLPALARLSPVQARGVELRSFGGLSIDETARALDLSPATVKRHWTVARAFLLRELQGSPPA